MQIYDLSCKVKSNPEPFLDRYPPAPVKSLENLIFFPRIDADSVIPHLKFHIHFILF